MSTVGSRMWKSFHGELELIVTVVVVSSTLLLSYTGIFEDYAISEQRIWLCVIVAMLIMLLYRNMSAKRELSQINTAISELRVAVSEGGPSALGFLKSRDQVGSISELILGGHQIDLSVLAGTLIVDDFEPFEEKIEKGANVRILMANPCDDEKLCTLVSRCEPITRGNTELLKGLIVKVVDDLVALKETVEEKGYSGTLDFRFQTIVPPFGIFAVNPNSPRGIIKIEMYSYRTRFENHPQFLLRKERDGHWYELFKRQFEEQWAVAETYNSIKEGL